MRFVAMKKQQVDEEHQDQNPSEGADDGGAGWGVEADREVDPQGGDQGAHGPANGEPGADAVGKQHGADGGNDQVAEHQQHAGDRHGRGHDETEGSVKKEVPEPDVDSLPLGFGGVGGNQEKFVPENIMEEADGTVEQGSFPDFSPTNGQIKKGRISIGLLLLPTAWTERLSSATQYRNQRVQNSLSLVSLRLQRAGIGRPSPRCREQWLAEFSGQSRARPG